jgi:phosphatidylglycerophosphatase A
MTAGEHTAIGPAPVDMSFLSAHPAHMVALVGGAGLAPYAPGTIGAAIGVPLGLLLADLSLVSAALILVVAFILGLWACGATATHAGVHDHPAIVFDETWAMAAVIAFVPAGILPVIVGFVAFRAFDILKPWPIGVIDRQVDEGWGIMLDDALAAVFAVALVLGLGWLGLV